MPSDTLYSLPLPQQVGQFFYIGLPGTELDAQARELIEEVKPGGVIINTGSKQGITCPPGNAPYNVSKAGVKVVNPFGAE